MTQPKTKIVPALELRTQLGKIMKDVRAGRVRVLVEKSGVPIVGIISAEEFRRVVAERDARFEVVEGIREKAPRVADAEIENDISEAVRKVRRRRL